MGATNKLYFGDNLSILRDDVEDASVDLIPLRGTRPSIPAPPITGPSYRRPSGRHLPVPPGGTGATGSGDPAEWDAAQITAFENTRESNANS
ncbi:MAG: hypothetical protein ABSB82_01095 [Terriglobia bacterium]|jgi:hypothetical protein